MPIIVTGNRVPIISIFTTLAIYAGFRKSTNRSNSPQQDVFSNWTDQKYKTRNEATNRTVRTAGILFELKA